MQLSKPPCRSGSDGSNDGVLAVDVKMRLLPPTARHRRYSSDVPWESRHYVFFSNP
ncbi:MAG: hypothetical protein J6X49_12035 [Victivallales bacterium]|nr:hypothetical protein [Victivallales bacterium]